MIVFLDSGIIGLLSSPNDRELAVNCQSWLFCRYLLVGLDRDDVRWRSLSE